MRERLSWALVVVLCAATVVGAQATVDYLNGIAYTWPTSQAASANRLLQSDGAGGLSWAAPPSAEGLWSGVIVPSLTDCPASGWTRVSAADGYLLVPWDSVGATGGTATHTHALSGLTGSTVVTISGNTAAQIPSVSGSTAVESISHTHAMTVNSTVDLSNGTDADRLISLSANSYNPSHSHTAGTLAMNSHDHSGTSYYGVAHSHAVSGLVVGTESNYPDYLDVVLCQRN
jgi:hypothetical protein